MKQEQKWPQIKRVLHSWIKLKSECLGLETDQTYKNLKIVVFCFCFFSRKIYPNNWKFTKSKCSVRMKVHKKFSFLVFYQIFMNFEKLLRSNFSIFFQDFFIFTNWSTSIFLKIEYLNSILVLFLQTPMDNVEVPIKIMIFWFK